MTTNSTDSLDPNRPSHAMASPSSVGSPSTPEAATTAAVGDLEHRYYRYLRSQSYITEAALHDVLRCYLPYFADFPRVLDIGCGHGEFLQLLQEEGHEAMGIDIDPAMVETCRAYGLTAIEGDAIAWLATQEGAFDAIFSSNVIEHMDAESVQALIRHAHRALRPGGMLLLGTPNPESLIVQFHEFWRDPTHVRLYARQLLEFFFADAGFIGIENGNNAAAAWEGIDQMIDPAQHPALTESTFAERTPPLLSTMTEELHPLPQPPAAGAPLRQRLAFRLLRFVYQKFLEPYVALLRHDLAQQRQYSLALQDDISRLLSHLRATNAHLASALQMTVQQQEARFQQVGNAFRFLYPPREFFVYGYKTAVTAPMHEQTQVDINATPPTGRSQDAQILEDSAAVDQTTTDQTITDQQG